MSLCEEYGLSMKVYAQKIAVYDREKYKEKDPVATIRESEIEGGSWESKLEGPIPAGSTPTRTRPPRRRSKSRWGPGPGS